MKVEEIINNFKDFDKSNEVSYQELIEDTTSLPLFLRETILHLEEELYDNPSHFMYILTRLAQSGFKWKFIESNQTYQVITSNGNILIM